MASLLAVPLVPSNFILIYGLAYPLRWTGDVPFTVYFAVAGLMGLEFLSVLLIARATERWLERRGLLGLLRWRLGTALALMLACSILFLFSFRTVHVRDGSAQVHFVGWPCSLDGQSYMATSVEVRTTFAAVLTVDATAWVVLLVAIAVACERLWGWRDRRHLGPTPSVFSVGRPDHLAPPPEKTLESLVPSVRERFLFAVPVFLFLSLVPLAIWLPGDAVSVATRLRLDLNGLTLLTFSVRESLMAFSLPFHIAVMLAVLLAYFAWACRERRRMIVFSMICLTAFSFGFLALCLVVAFPLLDFSHCVRRGTRIATPDGNRLVEDLRLGDSVTCLDREGRHVRGSVVAVMPGMAVSFLSIVLEDGNELQVTHEHPIALDTCWLRAKALVVGDTVLTEMGSRRIETITLCSKSSEVFDLTVEPYHNFFANGVLVHNALKRK